MNGYLWLYKVLPFTMSKVTLGYFVHFLVIFHPFPRIFLMFSLHLPQPTSCFVTLPPVVSSCIIPPIPYNI